MITKFLKPEKHGRNFSWGQVFWFALALFIFTGEAFAQNYEITINQRRMGDQIGVEFWVKSLNSSAPYLGNVSLNVAYNTDYLEPEATPTAYNTTDSVEFDINQTTAFTTITSQFNSLNDYGPLTAGRVEGNDGSGTPVAVYGLEVNLTADGTGYQPSQTGRGSFIGMLKFDIQDHGNITDADLTQIAFNTNTEIGDIRVLDADGNDVEANTTLTNPGNFTVRGIKLLSPNGPNQAVNRYPDPAYACLPSTNYGYPVYFERSGLIQPDAGVEYGTEKLAYLVEYSLDGGTSWNTVGRVAESEDDVTMMGANVDYFRSGEIDSVDATTDYFTTEGDGTAFTVAGDGYGGVIRYIWKADQNFPYRSEIAKLRMTQLDTTGMAAAITSRSTLSGTGRQDQSDYTFTLGRLFFVQLDGASYFRTKYNYSNSTQLTVEAWVNLNDVVATPGEDDVVATPGEAGIITSAAGPVSPEEGAWMLYLDQGVYPAFRAREKEGRSTGGYVATVKSGTALTAVSDATPIQDSHADNWAHIAATVENNTVTLYVNGEIVDQKVNNDAVNIRMLDTRHPIWIGVNPNFNFDESHFLNAGIKEPRVWRTALDQATLKEHIGGVYDPDGTVVALDPISGDERVALELAYTLQGVRVDVADDATYQNSANPLNYYTDTTYTATSSNTSINYRPDRSHLRLTSPVGGEGISNLEDETFQVRWVAYGIGSTTPSSKDLQIMWSRDNGTTWVDAIDNAAPAMPLDQVENETGYATWEPYNNITIAGQGDDLQGIVDIEDNWSKTVMLKISGTTTNGQDDIADTSASFTVAPYFALKNPGGSIISIPGSTTLNMSGAIGYIEAWIKPYDFPTTDEGYWPIVSKIDSTGEVDSLHYSFGITSDGLLRFAVGSETGTYIRTATSDANYPIHRPNVYEYDSVWTHVGVWFNLANGGTSTAVRFYIDGKVQSVDSISTQLGSTITVNNLNTFPAYIGYEPGTTPAESKSFNGELKEIRFWGNSPAGLSYSGTEPTAFTKFVQGALSVRSDELTTAGGTDYSQNLQAAFMMNGGSFVNNGYENSIGAYPASSGVTALISGSDVSYIATQPYLKLVEPVYEQSVANTTTDLKVRWVGFDYNRNSATTFYNGNDLTNTADLEYSVYGGGGLVIQPYQSVANQVYNNTYSNAWTLPTINSTYEFQGTSVLTRSQFASYLDVSNTDPDYNDDGTYSDQGEMAAAMTNGRLRLGGRATVNGSTLEYDNGSDGFMMGLLTESEYFNITPPSNFTVRVLLEGFHSGSAGNIEEDLGATYEALGVKISLYSNNANTPGVLVTTAESSNGYTSDTDWDDPTNRGTDGSSFANVPFVFTDIPDSRYFVVVDHLNHLPIMSKYAATFAYDGDDVTTWAIESGWDFQNWTGTNSKITESDAATVPPTIGTNFTAYGNAISAEGTDGYGTTGLIYNDGIDGDASTNQLASMVAGDTDPDGQINAADRARVVLDGSSYAYRSDVTGDGAVNSTDRTIVYRNNNKVSSLIELSQISGTNQEGEEPQMLLPYLSSADPMTVILPEAPELSNMFIEAAQRYLDRGGEKVHNTKPVKSNALQAGAIQYEVSATPYINNGQVFVPVYIKNTGADWALANANFTIQYDPATLRFDEMLREQPILFHNRQDVGYFNTFTSPSENAKDPYSDARSVEINFDNYSADLPGINVPAENSYLGTLVFNLIDPSATEIEFAWHRITAVHDVSDGNVTEYGKFLMIEPILISRDAMVITPNGNEEWRAGRLYTITWTKPTFDKFVYIEYSLDNGATWTRINSEPITIDNREYNWQTPRTSSTECLVQMIDAETNLVIDRSDAPFALLPAPAEITRPSSSDPAYTGNVEDKIVWYVEDNENIKFEFSENGSDNWVEVTPSVNSLNGQVSWVLPAVNTKHAVIRMVNVNNGDVMTESEPFKVLAGSVELSNISHNNEVKMGETRSIMWKALNVDKFDLQLTTNGNEWQTVQRDINALKGTMKWDIPNVETESAILRAIWNNDSDMEYSRTSEFSILKPVGVEELNNSGYTLEKPAPNPFSSQASISFTLPFDEMVTITLFNSAGMKIQTLVDAVEYQSGSHTVTLYGNDLPAGVYYIHLSAGAYNMSREVVLVK